MQVIAKKTYDEASAAAADLLAAAILMKRDAKLGLATGATPVGCYKELVKKYESGMLDFSRVTTANLDEYRGLDGSHEQSYRYFMDSHLFNLVNIDKSRTYVPDGTIEDPDKACSDYDKLLDEKIGAFDIQLLGIGSDGHIGFNEPCDYFNLKTQCITLEESTVKDNARLFFGGDLDAVPRQAYTMGIGFIMRSKKIIIMATGESKRDIVEKAFCGPVTPQVPASILQLHPDVVLVGDAAAIPDAVVEKYK
ncbi:glucosamine-6-phosphate deaminase [Butyrivibrio sp. MC2013]|uniref:glucosamine-6-phosphate deaminase n=1 Tax=Butyrivibrio sp. MC2013 TaxID=1280686 RepID=UPI0003FCBBC6|nr:glucosamine-6-phosphate deaminase [Butyrivibrio sp. MC2013]